MASPQPSVRARARPVTVGGFDAVQLRAGELEATIVPGVGMVAASLLHRGEQLLGRADRLARYAETGSSMGIPLLHPWANRLAGNDYPLGDRRVDLAQVGAAAPVRRDENGLPIHGLLSASRHWRADAPQVLGGVAQLTALLDFGAHSELLAGFPVAHILRLTYTLERHALTVTTEVWPTAEHALPVCFGFHPYLRLPGVARADWLVGVPARRHLSTDERGIPTGAGDEQPAAAQPLGERVFDDGYDAIAAGASFTLAGGGRRIEVAFQAGYPAAQVFAPAAEDVICFEPMTAPTNALRSAAGLRVVAPGERFAARFAIAVRDG